MRGPVLVSVAARPVTVLVARDGDVDDADGVVGVDGRVGTRRVESAGSGVPVALIVDAESTTTGTADVSADSRSPGAHATASRASRTVDDERMRTPASRW